MKITKVFPRGFCFGVINAWDITKKAKKEHPNHKIFLIGSLVHNNEMMKKIIQTGILIADDKNKTRLDIIKDILKNHKKEEIILIFSAHGTEKVAIEFAKKNKIIYYDTVCEYVKKTHQIINDKINESKIIFYIGVNNHPESIATLSINKDKIFLIENEKDVIDLSKKINKWENIFVTNQTTISIYDFFYINKKIKELFINCEIKNDICDAALKRQNAIINLSNDVDLLIVVGDKKSNNTNKMLSIGLNKKIESYLVETKKDLKIEWFEKKKHVAITSGASTPTWITNDVIKWIENL